MNQVRELLFYRHYFHDFFKEQSARVQEKIDYTLFLVTHVERIPEKFLKHLDGTKGLYEVRIEVGKSIFRIFCCFDRGNLVVLFNGFQKKSQKTPKQELDLAAKLMQQYFNEQNQ